MNQDYVPNKRMERKDWYQNMSDKVVAEAVKFGGKPADATTIKGIVDGIYEKMDATDTAQAAVDSARLMEGDTEKAGLAQLRAMVAGWKTLPGWAASGSSAVLKVDGTNTTFDPNTYQTTLTASLVPGGVKLSFVKKGVEGVAFYSRLAGTVNWVKIGSANHSPFIDHTPLAKAGVAEQREYMARGIVKDAELPLDSTPVIITFAG